MGDPGPTLGVGEESVEVPAVGDWPLVCGVALLSAPVLHPVATATTRTMAAICGRSRDKDAELLVIAISPQLPSFGGQRPDPAAINSDALKRLYTTAICPRACLASQAKSFAVGCYRLSSPRIQPLKFALVPPPSLLWSAT